jgi:hypothetical protein
MADRILRVCLSSELPLLADRKPNYMYFLYDKLILFVGQSLYNDPYVIAEDVPEEPVNGMIYICLDGFVKVYVDYTITKIAEIESSDQIEILKKAGTAFFVNAEQRYLDLRRRIITLPYQNGTYELTVSLANDLKIDKDTVIGFNPETNTFEIIGNRQDYGLVFSKGYEGKDSDTVKTEVDEHTIRSELKISRAYDNMIKVTDDGIYANADTKVTKKQFESWTSQFAEYKSYMEAFLRDLVDKIDDSQDIVSEDSINKRIHEALLEVYPEIDKALEQLDEMASKFDGIESRSKAYTDESFDNAKSELSGLIIDATENPWEIFGEDTDDEDDNSTE